MGSVNFVSLAILCCVLAVDSHAFADPKPIPLCAVLGHPNERMEEHVVVRGTIEQLEHGVYLFAVPPCDQKPTAIIIQGTDPQAYRAAGGRKGVGVQATVDGELVMSKTGVPEYIKTPYRFDFGECRKVVIGQLLKGEPKGFDGTLKALEQIHRHEGLKALLAVALFEFRAALDLGVVEVFVFRKPAWQNVADRRIQAQP